MKYTFLLILLCLVMANVNARQVITGIVTDKETSLPVESASAELLQLPDSITIESMITNSDGTFMFYKADTTKNYCLRIKHVSYKTFVIPVAKKTGGMINNVGTIAIEPSVFNFKDVIINGSKVRVTELADRTIYGISSDMKKTSTDGLDVLRKIPSVQVDYFNENITVDGKSNIKIEVDGVTRDKEFLKKLHPSQVDKMEIITNPSGKYDADVDAVVNVVTIKEMRYGLKGNENTQLVPYGTNTYLGRFNGGFDYGLEKISYYIAANGGANKFNFFNTLNRHSDSDTTSLFRNGSQPSKNYNGNINGGFIYDPDIKNNLNFNVAFNGSKAISDADNFNYNTDAKKQVSIYEATSHADNRSNGLTTSLFYKHKFDKKTQHGYEIEANYYHSLNNNNKTIYQNINYSPDTVELSRSLNQTEENNTKSQNFYTQANYTLPFDSVYTFMIGVSGNFNRSNTNNISSLTNAPNLDYTEMRGGSFTEISKTFKKGSAKIGARIEAAHVSINSTVNQYFSPLPYANAFYKINQRNSIKINYSRRVIRPSSSQLNPFVSVVDSQTIHHGNINLQPAYRDNFQLTFNAKYGKSKFSGSVSPQLFFEARTKLIQNVTFPDTIANKAIFETVPMNISNGYEAGLGLSLNAQIFVVMFNSNFRYSYNHTDRYKDQIDQINVRTWRWNSYAVCPLPLNFRFFTVLNINGPSINGQEQSRMAPFYLFGLVKQFKNNSSLNILIFNPFTTKLFDNKTTLNTSAFRQQSESYLNLRNAIMLNYTYNFKIGKDINREKHDSEQNIEDNINKLPF